VAIILGHWSLLLHGKFHPHMRDLYLIVPAGILLKAEWAPGLGCTITTTNSKVLAATFIYSMAFDFIVMSLTAIKLVSPTSRNRSKLVHLIFQDGLIYFILA